MNIITTKIQEIEMNEEYLLLKCTNINLNIKIINGTIDIIIKTPWTNYKEKKYFLTSQVL